MHWSMASARSRSTSSRRRARTRSPSSTAYGARSKRSPARNCRRSVEHSILEGAALTIAIVFLFLSSWRSTVITGLTLPISLIGTFLVMYAMGFTINLVTLLALSICVGLLIDDAIVVRENIVRHQALGEDHRTASLKGTAEIGLAVTATTLTIVAVFLPIGFMVAFAVLLSMFVSFTLDPMLSSVWHDPDAHGPRGRGPIAWILRRFQALMLRLEGGYVALLRWGLSHRAITMVLALAAFLSAFPLIGKVGKEFVPQADNNELYVQFYTPAGSPLVFTEQRLRMVEAALREFEGVTLTYGTINTGVALGRNYASVFARLVDRTQRELSVQQMRAPVRERLRRIPGITLTDLGNLNTVGSGKPIQISVQGQDMAELERIGQLVQQAMRAVNDGLGREAIVEIDTSSKPAKPTITVDIDRALASDLGLSVARLSQALRPLIAGESATTWRAPDDENYDVRVRLPATNRS